MGIQSIFDLNEKEVTALNDEEIKSFIDIECARKGVVLLPPEPVKPKKPDVKLDATFYEFCSLHFDNPEAAAAVMEEVSKYSQYTYEYKAGGKVFRKDSYYSSTRVSAVQGMTDATYNKHKKELDKYDIESKEYDAEKKLYDKAVEARKGIVREVEDYVEKSHDKLREEKIINDTWLRYTVLAKNDLKVAYDFLIAAKPSLDLYYPHTELWSKINDLANPVMSGDEAQAS